MGLIQIIVLLVVVGFILYAVNTWLPMDGKVKTILNAVVILILGLWLLSLFFPGLNAIHIQ